MAAGELFTPDNVSVTATPQAVVLEQGLTYTIRNTDAANSVYWIYKPSALPQGTLTAFAGLAAALKTLGGSEIIAGSQVTLRDAPPWIAVVCATGLTATLEFDVAETGPTGGVTGTVTEASAADIKTALQAITGAGYTVKSAIFNGKTTTQDLIALVAGKKITVVGGIITLGAAGGTVAIASNATPLSPAFNMVVGGALNVLPRPMTRPIWQTAAGEALKVIITGGGTVSGQLEYIEV